MTLLKQFIKKKRERKRERGGEERNLKGFLVLYKTVIMNRKIFLISDNQQYNVL